MSSSNNKGRAAPSGNKKAVTATAARKAEAMRNFDWTEDLIKRYAYSDRASEALPEEQKPAHGPGAGTHR